MSEPTWTAKIENGIINLRNQQEFNNYLRQFEGEEVSVKVSEKTDPGTLSQKAYLWGAVLPKIADHTGHTEDELYSVFLDKYAPKELIEYGGETRTTIVTLSNMTRKQATEFIDKIIAEAASMGIQIQSSEEYRKSKAM